MLSEKICVVTGASQGIGFSIAERFAENGATTILLGRSGDRLQAAKSRIELRVPDCSIDYYVCNVANSDDVKSTFKGLFKARKRLDVLVCNAGIMDDAYIGMVTREQIENTFAVNTFGAMYCAQYAARLIARSGGGSIINVGSIMGVQGNVGQAVYSASKSALSGLTKSLAKELAHQGIRVNSINPGFINTDMTSALDTLKRDERVGKILLSRAGEPEEVANLALFLASDQSSYITGQEIGIDGGMTV